MSEDRIEVVPYDPSWPQAYRRERDALLKLLGDRIAEVVHVGSTAVPGLAAKPTVDLMIGAEDPAADEAVVSAFARLGYRHLGEHGVPGRQFFRKGQPPSRHAHWTRKGGDFWRELLLLRDFLRAHPEEAACYEAFKRGMANRFPRDREGYTRSKRGLIAELMERARVWRAGLPCVVFDLEATCWEEGTRLERQEIIEVGAVRLRPGDLEVEDRFVSFVRPEREPRLSGFCRRLTGIRQEEVDAAPAFGPVLRDFASWIGDAPVRLFSWGEYDHAQAREECRRRGRDLPPCFEGHLDLRGLFARSRGLLPGAVREALAALGMAPEGAAHRAFDDALNVARILRRVLPELDA